LLEINFVRKVRTDGARMLKAPLGAHAGQRGVGEKANL